VDALSTAIVMEMSDIVDEILAFIPTIDFTTTAAEVSLFETTVRTCRPWRGRRLTAARFGTWPGCSRDTIS
jgi:hypothetical protein